MNLQILYRASRINIRGLRSLKSIPGSRLNDSIVREQIKPSSADDPYPLPLQHQFTSLTSDSQSENLPMQSFPGPIQRDNESIDVTRARLLYQSRKRGILETDLLLSTFAQSRLGTWNKEELDQFDQLLDEPDWDIYYWSIMRKTPPAKWKDSALLKELQKHAANEEKVVRKMPELS